MSSTFERNQADHEESEGQCFSFTLLMSGAKEATEELANCLYSAGCDDALLSASGGHLYLDFDRMATSLEAAINSAIENAERVKGVRVIKVLPEGAKVISAANAFLKVRGNAESIFRRFLGR